MEQPQSPDHGLSLIRGLLIYLVGVPLSLAAIFFAIGAAAAAWHWMLLMWRG